MGQLRTSEAVRLFLKWAKVNLAPGTVAGYAHYFNRFIKWTKDVRVAKVTPAMVETWSNKWHAVQAVQRLFAWLHRQARKIKTNPLEGMKRPAGKMRRRVLCPTEMVRLLRGANHALRRFLVAMRETIARPGEIRLATWESIRTAGNLPGNNDDLVNGRCFFFVLVGKGIQRRTDADELRLVPITPRLGRMLVRLASSIEDPDGTIFLDAKERAWTGRGIREAMRRLRQRAGLVADFRGERIVAYTMRHTGATNAVAAGVRDSLLGAMMGHSTPRMTRRYVHVQPDMIVEGMNRIIEAKTAKRAKKDRPGLRRNDPDASK